MLRIADALEDAGRKEEARWAFAESGYPDRRSAYLQALASTRPEWRRKWTLKLLKDDPQDDEAQHLLQWLDVRASRRESTSKTRDVPRA